ncbi:MAG: hypothetical protein LQ350_005243 [Teloschistes chrysophthalmus]|nr:MAG: hypothetical protein LQ350_005243 [Niorma chrysophthalma]
MCQNLGSTREELAKVSKDKSDYWRRLQSCMVGQDDFVKRVDKMGKEVEEAKKETEYFTTEYHSALGREGQLSRQLADVQTTLGQWEDKEQEDEKMQRELKHLRKENKFLKTTRCLHSEPSPPAADPQASQDSRENTDGARATNTAVAEQRPGLSAVRGLRSKYDALVQELEKVKKLSKTYQNQVDQEKKTTKKAEADRDKAKRELAEAKTLRTNAESDSRDADAAWNDAMKALEDCDQEHSKTKNQLAEKEALLKGKDDELTKATSTNHTQQETIRLLQRQVKERIDSSGELQNARSENERLNGDLNELRNGQNTAEQYRAQLTEEFRIAGANLKQEYDQRCEAFKHNTRASYEAELRKQLNEYKTQAQSEWSQLTQEGEAKYSRMQALFSRLFQVLGVNANVSPAELVDHVVALGEQIGTLQNALGAAQTQIEQLNQVYIAPIQASDWEQQPKKFQELYNLVYGERKKLLADNSTLSDLNKSKERQLREVQRERNTGRTTKERLTKENGQLTTERDDLQGQIKTSQIEKKDLESAVDGLNDQIKESKKEKDGLENSVRDLQGQIGEFHNEKNRLQKTVEELQTADIQISSDIKALRQEKKDEEEKVAKLRKEKCGFATWRDAMIEGKRAAAGNPGPSTGRHERDETDPDLQDSRDTKQPKNGL